MTLKVYLFPSGDEADQNLMVTCLVIQTYKEQMACGITKVVNSVVAAGNMILKWERHLVQRPVGDTHAPYELFDVRYMFLVWLGREDY